MLGATHIDWEQLKTFAVLAALGTVRSASRELNIHHSTVSRRVEQLEAEIGVRLFDRVPQGLNLTSAGEQLLSITQAFGESLNDTERQISGRDDDLTGLVTVTMAEPVAVHAIAPRLNEFAEKYPGLEVRIIVSVDYLDVARREADIAIRMDNNPPETLVGKRLFPYYQTIYATPEYLKNHDLINHPETGRWIRWDNGEGKYPNWTQETEFDRVPAWGHFPELNMQHAAAKHSLGIAMLPCFIGDRDPSLVRATNREPIKSRDIWLLTHSDLKRTARIKAFMRFAEDVMRANKRYFIGS